MPINIDDLLISKTDCDVIVATGVCSEINIDFARIPSKEVLQSLEDLRKIAGIEIISYFLTGLDFNISVPKALNKFKIAEAIAQCFVNDHGLRVERRIDDRSLAGITPNADRKVETFLKAQ